MQYTEQDVKDALYANYINGAANVEQKTPFEIIYADEAEFFHDSIKSEKEVWSKDQELIILEELWDLKKPEDRAVFLDASVRPQMARYERGREILESQQLVYSERWMPGLSSAKYDKLKRRKITSAIVTQPAGYVATTEHFRFVALMARKKAA